jgi:hypothetical protein
VQSDRRGSFCRRGSNYADGGRAGQGGESDGENRQATAALPGGAFRLVPGKEHNRPFFLVAHRIKPFLL